MGSKGKNIVFSLQLISANVAFIKHRVIHPAFSQKIAAGKVGMAEVKIQRMVRGNAVKGVEFGKLAKRKHILNIGGQVEIQFSEVDVDPLSNSCNEVFNLFHFRYL